MCFCSWLSCGEFKNLKLISSYLSCPLLLKNIFPRSSVTNRFDTVGLLLYLDKPFCLFSFDNTLIYFNSFQNIYIGATIHINQDKKYNKDFKTKYLPI